MRISSIIISKEVQNLKSDIKIKNFEERQVTLHCSYLSDQDTKIRIWKPTFLFDNQNKVHSTMIHCEGISMNPSYTYVFANQKINFTLYFRRLLPSCVTFDLTEKIPEPGGFKAFNIERNEADVYFIDIA